MFTTDFNRFTCDGDSISCEVDGITYCATIHRDDCDDAPDERDCGFWPSLNPNDDGYIGPKSKSTLARHKAHAERVMAAWRNDDWWYCGVVLSAEIEGVPLLDEYRVALWGVECNYPERGKRRPNLYLREVADELLSEAESLAKARRAELAAKLAA